MGALCLFLAVACGYDYKSNRIPNYLVIMIGVFGAGRRLLREEVPGMLAYLGVAVLVLALMYPFFKIGGLGAGDVKLLGVTAGYLPFKKILVFLFVSLLFAAIISIFKMWKKQNFDERLRYLLGYMADVIRSGSWKFYLENETDRRAVGICLSGPVLLSILLYLGGAY